MNLEHLWPVATLVLGWFLNSFTSIVQDQRNHRKAVNKAIADLLEIRHELLAKRSALSLLKSIEGIPADQLPMIWGAISKSLPQITGDVSARYNEVVTLIASSNPLLGFQLRSKDFATKFGSVFTTFESLAGQPIPMIGQMEERISDAAIPHLNEVIRDLARHGGFFLALKINRFLKDDVELPDEAKALWSSLKAEVEKMTGVQKPKI